MRITVVLLVVMVLALASGVSSGADWPEWRGPGRDGVALGGPALTDGFPEGGPRELWRCRGIPGHGDGGYGSVSVSGGRAYVYANTRIKEHKDEKVLSDQALRELGWIAGLPDEVWDTLEEARTSPERKALAADKVDTWAEKWVSEQIAEEMKRYRAACAARLKLGLSAMPLAVLRTLQAGRKQEFAGEAELRTWLEQEKVPNEWWQRVVQKAEVVLQKGYDDIFCIDAATGTMLWTKRYPGQTYPYQCSSTPCIAGGRCYVGGSGGALYCLDATTGEEIWQATSQARTSQQVGSSFLVHDGVAVILGGGLMGLDAATGKVLWTQKAVQGVHASAALWRCGDRTLLICNGAKDTFCVEPGTGEIVWKIPGGGWSTPAIHGDLLALYTRNTDIGLAVYRLSTEGMKQLWRLPYSDRGASPVIHNGFVYAIGGWKAPHAVCVGLESGELAWEQTVAATEISSPVVADGKIWHVFGMGSKTSVYCLRATPRKYELLGTTAIPAVTATSPAIVDGKIYLRLPDAVACYDLTHAPMAP